MKYAARITKAVVLPLVLLTSLGCIGIRKSDLMATQKAEVWPTVATEVWQTAEVEVAAATTAVLTSVPATPTAEAPPTVTPSPRVALVSFHGRYVTAAGAGGSWLLSQDQDLNPCGFFTLRYLGAGKVALMTCHDRYVTAPKTGATRSDWRLYQESDLSDCGEFVLYDLGGYKVAFETCAGNVLTAGDGGWPGELAWAIVGETPDIKAWEGFEMLKLYTPLQSMIVNFTNCTGFTKLGGEMGAAFDPSSGDTAVVSYVKEDGRGCIARLEYEMEGWVGFWIRLQGLDLSPYRQLVFDVQAASQDIPERIKIELKRADSQQVSILYHVSEITTDWQTMAVSLSDLRDSLPSFTEMQELVFVFEANGSRKTGIIYLDNVALR